MTVILPSSSLAAIGRQSPLLRLPPSSRCSIYLALQHQQSRDRVLHPQLRFASNKLHPGRTAIAASANRLQGEQKLKRVPSPDQSLSVAHVSSTSATATSGNPYDFSDKINPPSTTLPVPLDVPNRQPDQGTIRYYITVGKAYWAFYKAGIKNVWRNAQERRRLVRRVRASKKTAPPAMPSTKQNAVLDERALGQYANYPFTRAEYQFFIRSWRDAKRIPVFVVMLGLFGEYLPLVVMFCTPLVPYTCRIPRQIRSAREKLEERRSRSFRGDMGGVPGPLKHGTGGEIREIADLDAVQVRHIARSLGLYFTFWDRLGTVWPANFVLRNKVKKRLQYLDIDDALFRRDGGIGLLNAEEEIRIAAEDRGIDILNRKTDEVHRILKSWEQGAQEGRTLSMLLSRPSVWAPTPS